MTLILRGTAQKNFLYPILDKNWESNRGLRDVSRDSQADTDQQFLNINIYKIITNL